MENNLLKAQLNSEVQSLTIKRENINEGIKLKYTNSYPEVKIIQALDFLYDKIYFELPQISDRLYLKHQNQLNLLLNFERKEEYIQAEILKIGKIVQDYYKRDWFPYKDILIEIFQIKSIEIIVEKYLVEESLLKDYSPRPFPRENLELRQLKCLIEAEVEIKILKLEFENLLSNQMDKEITAKNDIQVEKSSIETLAKSSKKNTLWFQTGLLFANGTMDKYWNDSKTGAGIKYTIPAIAKAVNLRKGEKYILASFNGYENTDKNIFNNRKKMEIIIDHLKNENKQVASSFLDKMQSETT